MLESPQVEVNNDGPMLAQVIQPTTHKVETPGTAYNLPQKTPISVFITVYFVATFIFLLLFPFVADVILSQKNTSRLNQVTTAVQEVLGDKADINKDNMDIRCYQAERTDFGKGTTFCDRRLTYSTFVDESNKEDIGLKYQSIVSKLVANGWGTYSKPRGTLTESDPKYDFNVDLDFRGNSTCNGNAIYNQNDRNHSYSLSMDCGWYKASQSIVTRLILLIIVMAVGWRFCQSVFAKEGKKAALIAAIIITLLFMLFYGDLFRYILLPFS